MRNRSFGVRNRCVTQTIACSTPDSCPIPVWRTATTQIETGDIEKLKRFCIQQYTYLQEPWTQEDGLPQKKLALHFIAFLSFGIYLCLNTLTSSHNFSSNTLLSGSRGLNSSTSKAGAIYEFPYQLPLELSSPPRKTAAEKAKNSISQGKVKAVTANKATLGFISPVKGFPVTSSFGSRVHPIFGGDSFHQGIDLGTPSGTPVKASKAGYVTFAGSNGGYGKKIVIRHGEGYETLYAHLDELLVEVGDRVKQEEVIGLSGSTGYVTGPHLHFEIHSDQVAHNPLDYF
jgi:hypothetical protein